MEVRRRPINCEAHYITRYPIRSHKEEMCRIQFIDFTDLSNGYKRQALLEASLRDWRHQMYFEVMIGVQCWNSQHVQVAGLTLQ